MAHVIHFIRKAETTDTSSIHGRLLHSSISTALDPQLLRTPSPVGVKERQERRKRGNKVKEKRLSRALPSRIHENMQAIAVVVLSSLVSL